MFVMQDSNRERDYREDRRKGERIERENSIINKSQSIRALMSPIVTKQPTRVLGN